MAYDDGGVRLTLIGPRMDIDFPADIGSPRNTYPAIMQRPIPLKAHSKVFLLKRNVWLKVGLKGFSLVSYC